MRGDDRVRPETVERVLASARAVGYRLNGAARALATLRHDTIGVVFPNLSGPYYAGVILGLEQAANALGQSVLIAGTQGRLGSEALVLDLATKVDGLVLFGRTVPDALVVELEARQVPVVLLARPQIAGASTVRAENRQSAEALASHLIEHGHRQIVFIGDPSSSPDADERWEGYLAAHASAGIEPTGRPYACAFTETEGQHVTRLVLARPSRPTALFCANDEIAMGAYAAAAEAGVEVSKELAVTGWDDIPVARLLAPPLTTVRQPLAELGALAAQLLQDRVKDRLEGAGGEPVTALLPTEVVLRASCGCLSRRRPKEGGGASR
jgi:LacI family transcriptional regulator